jgi:hypothetical protein
MRLAPHCAAWLAAIVALMSLALIETSRPARSGPKIPFANCVSASCSQFSSDIGSPPSGDCPHGLHQCNLSTSPDSVIYCESIEYDVDCLLLVPQQNQPCNGFCSLDPMMGCVVRYSACEQY